MFDIELLRNERLIEERESYENDFISIEDIIKSDELDYYACPQYEEYFLESFENNQIVNYDEYMDELDLKFDFEDYLLQLRDEQLIEQREEYELSYFSKIYDKIVEYDPLDILIQSHDNYIEYEFECYYDDYNDYCDYDGYCDIFVEEPNYMEAAYFGNKFLDYIPNDDIFDRLDGCDYPEGPDENLEGINYIEPYFQKEYFCQCLEYTDDFEDYSETYYVIEDDMGVNLYEREENYLQMLIDNHIEEEIEFFMLISNIEIPEEYYPPEVIDDIIFC